MKKITLLISSILLGCFMNISAQSIVSSTTTSLEIIDENSNNQAEILRGACESVLPNYVNSANTANGGPSQTFEASNVAFDSQMADDFIVPGTGNATICQVSITGSGVGLPTNVNNTVILRIYDNASGIPGTELFSQTFLGSAIDADANGSFSLFPVGVPDLVGGTTYWLSVQADMDFATGGQWFWTTATDGNGFPYVFRNPGNGFTTGCTVWASGCAVAGSTGPDLMMNISFNAVILSVDENQLNNAVVMYLNPADTHVNLKKESQIALIDAQIYDIHGKLISKIDLTQMNLEKSIDVSHLSSGLYMVKINSQNASIVKRLVKK